MESILAGVKSSQFFYKFFLTSIVHCGIIITVKQTRKQKEDIMYSEQLNIFSGACRRTVNITVFEELQQAGVFVYDTNKKQIYDVHIFYGEVFNKQKLPPYLNKIVTNVINLFM